MQIVALLHDCVIVLIAEVLKVDEALKLREVHSCELGLAHESGRHARTGVELLVALLVIKSIFFLI